MTHPSDGGEARTSRSIQEHDLGWDDISAMTGKTARQLADRWSDHTPKRSRRLLSVWLAERLDYSSFLRDPETLGRDALWSLLREEVFDRLEPRDEDVLLAVADLAAIPVRAQLPELSALAALALWRHAECADRRERARALLIEYALPDEVEWLDELVGIFYGIGAEHKDDPPGLYELAALQLEAEYREHAAHLVALYFARRFVFWNRGTPTRNMTIGCDRAARSRIRDVADWLQLLADAAVEGQLRFPWLERPMRAVLRLSVEDGSRYRHLDQYHRRRLYDTDYARLEDLYGDLLDQCFARKPDVRQWASRQILREVQMAGEDNPRRAQRLIELRAIREHPLRVGSIRRRLEYATRRITQEPELTPFDSYLAGLYVVTHAIEPYARQLVGELADRIDWSSHPLVEREQLEQYLEVSDYDRAFRDLSTQYGGTNLDLADADAAADVRYFVEKRYRASSVTRFVNKLMRPIAWLGSALVRTDPVQHLLERGVMHLEARLRDVDLEQYVVETYRENDVAITSFEEIAGLNTDLVDELLETARRRSLLLGSLAGGAAGGLGAFHSELLSLADVPVVLAIGIDISSRFCWFYGFDPHEHPDIPVEILAVALEGPSPSPSDPEVLRQDLGAYAIQSSLWVEAAASRSLQRIAGRAVRGLSDILSRGELSKTMARSAEELIEDQFETSVTPAQRSFSLLGACLGGVWDATLIYDILEAARIVLMDRFLERKYSGWKRRITPQVEGETFT